MKLTARTIQSRSFPARRPNSVTAPTGSWRLLTISLGLALLALGSLARAAETGYESFNYASGGFVSGTPTTGAGFTGNWTCGTPGTVIAGLTYPGLPVANNALRSAGARQFVSLSSSLTTGSKWISFLYQTSAGNSGGNKNGVFFPNGDPTCLWFGFGLNPFSSTQGYLGLGSMTTAGTAAASATSLQQLGLGTYGAKYLVVLKIDFDTSGNNDTVTVYLNPMANQAAPGVAAAGTISSFDVGTISGVGLNVQGAGEIIVDEIRVGDTYGDVVGYVNTPPNTPTGLNATPGANQVSLSWTAATGSPTSYRVKRSTISGAGYVTIATNLVPTVTFTDSVTGGTTFYYVVSAVNSSGESANSSEASALPTLAPPAAPTGLTATPGDALVTLNWTASSFATSYNLKRATALAGPYTLIGTTIAPAVTYTDSNGLNNGTTYYYVVSATGSGGAGTDTAPVSATPISSKTTLTIARGAGISWFASNSVTYQVQWSGALQGTNTVWNNLGGSITGNGITNTVFDPVGPPHNFFQVLSIQ
jgi:hypothetical protein